MLVNLDDIPGVTAEQKEMFGFVDKGLAVAKSLQYLVGGLLGDDLLGYLIEYKHRKRFSIVMKTPPAMSIPRLVDDIEVNPLYGSSLKEAIKGIELGYALVPATKADMDF